MQDALFLLPILYIFTGAGCHPLFSRENGIVRTLVVLLFTLFFLSTEEKCFIWLVIWGNIQHAKAYLCFFFCVIRLHASQVHLSASSSPPHPGRPYPCGRDIGCLAVLFILVWVISFVGAEKRSRKDILTFYRK